MTEQETVRVDTAWDEERWDELTDLIDEFEDSRRRGKKHYSQQAFKLALEYLQEKKQEQQKTAQEFQNIQREMKQILEDE